MGMNQTLCPKCRREITGRAMDMESFLQVVFFPSIILCTMQPTPLISHSNLSLFQKNNKHFLLSDTVSKLELLTP